jgi:hypothetical protein
MLKTTHTAKNTAQKYTLVNSVPIFSFEGEIVYLPFRSCLDLLIVHQYWYCVAILRWYNFDPLWDYHIVVLVLF